MSFPVFYWGFAAFFYLYQFILRVSVSTLTGDLIRDFHITASDVGTLIGLSSFCYVAMQIPAGTLLDKIGTKTLLFVAPLVTASGALLFSLAQGMPLLWVARILLGTGSAFAFVSASKVISFYFPEKRMAFMVSMTILIGTAGGVVGTGPFAALIGSVGWRAAVLLVALVGFSLSFCIYIFGRFHKLREPLLKESTPLWEGFKTAIGTPQVRIITLWGFFYYIPLSVFADAWGVSYIAEALSLSKSEAANAVGMIYVGVLFGCPLYGWLGGFSTLYRLIFTINPALLLIIFFFILWHPVFIFPVLKPLLWFTGVVLSGQFLMFPAAVRNVPLQMTGSVVGIVNAAAMLGGTLFQKLVGVSMDLLWDGRVHETGPHYSALCYQWPLSIILLFMVGAMITAQWIRPPHHENLVP